MVAREISAWFGDHYVLDRVSLTMPAGAVTALIGPSGCGKSTFLRILNRMHEMIPSAALAGEVLLDGTDIYDVRRKVIDARRQIGMVFQKPNPFPAMSIYDNMVAGLRLTGTRVRSRHEGRPGRGVPHEGGTLERGTRPVASTRRRAVRRTAATAVHRASAGRSSTCAADGRAVLRARPDLDATDRGRPSPSSSPDVTIVIVTHNMQQAARVSDQCAFFLAEQNTPGVIVEHGPTDKMFDTPVDPRTADYVMGRFG